eukprot:CAMPEP_0198284994 /NCGR_PEP_ID=MMETSP1449-20131203/4324_1 /TAXON_ID=420275 /ORGANISM="Attheya septentrionalis, Strain CCMP2084" /LENGTH=641 /DNA_ID=CAMNT_0043982219 /DNA_START=369 /DNA_END=2291 /DNA_ORIENTATION=+
MIPLAEFGTPLSVEKDDDTTTSRIEIVDHDVVSDMMGMTVNDIPTRDAEEPSNVAAEQDEVNDDVVSQEMLADDLEETVVHMEDIRENSVNVMNIYRNIYSKQKSTTVSDAATPIMEVTQELVQSDPAKELQDFVSVQLNGIQPEPSSVPADDTTKEESSNSETNEVVGSDTVKELKVLDKEELEPEEVVASDTATLKDGANQGQEIQDVSGSESQDVMEHDTIDTIVELQDFAKEEIVEAVHVVASASMVDTQQVVEHEEPIAEREDILAIEMDDETEGAKSKLETTNIKEVKKTILPSVVDDIKPEVPKVDKVIANESDKEPQEVKVEIIASSKDASEIEAVNTHLDKQKATRATPTILKKVMKRTPFWDRATTTEEEGLVPFVFEALTPFVSLEELKEKTPQDAFLHSAVNVVKAALGSGKTAVFSLGALTEVASDDEVKDWSSMTMAMIRQAADNQMDSNPLEACGKILQSAGSTASAALACLMSLDSTKLAVEAASDTTRSLVSAGTGMSVFLSSTVVQAKYLMKQIEAKRLEEEEMRLKEEKQLEAKRQEEEKVKELETRLHKKRAEEETKLLLQLQREAEAAQMKLELDRQVAKEAGFEKLAREMEEQRQALLHSLANGDSSSSPLDVQEANAD